VVATHSCSEFPRLIFFQINTLLSLRSPGRTARAAPGNTSILALSLTAITCWQFGELKSDQNGEREDAQTRTVPPLARSKNGTNPNDSRTFALKSKSESGRDCLMCGIFAGQRTWISWTHWARFMAPVADPASVGYLLSSLGCGSWG